MKQEKTIKITGTDISISDGDHTFEELYAHRIELFIALCRQRVEYRQNPKVWRSWKHSDKTNFDDWFILGVEKEVGKQITYHIPGEYWDECGFAEVLDLAPEFDGHTAKDVLLRLRYLN